LAVPSGRRTRPTSDRVREALFSTLLSVLGDLGGARVLDLYAGTGALGLEALSRGADDVLLIEADERVVPTLRANVDAVALPGARVRVDRAERVVDGPPDAPYDVAFLDPPYRQSVEDVVAVVGALTQGWLSPGAAIVVERSSRDSAFPWPEGFEVVRDRSYGEVRIEVALW
jgi:16S rRNA (guanine966-N2)-methyltransferase